MVKLKEFSNLKEFFESHITDGLYMLQFRKCSKASCCVIKKGPLPPQVPAPVLAPDKEHYVSFEELYGKVTTTEKDCPSLQSKASEKKDSLGGNLKFLANRVVTIKECCLCAEK